MNSHIETTPQKFNHPNILLTPEEVLAVYYRPLIEYQDKSLHQNHKVSDLLSEPLWRFRQLTLEEERITEQLKAFVSKEQATKDKEIFLLLRLTYGCNQPSASFSSLSDDEKINLIKIAEKGVDSQEVYGLRDIPSSARYATSLLITLFLRDQNKSYRIVALALLQEGEYLKDIPISNRGNLSVKLKLGNHGDLLQTPYIDFSYSNLTALGEIKKINFSGQYLKSIKAVGVTFKGSTGCSFRYACLDGAQLQSTTLTACDFTGACLWEADLRGTTTLSEKTYFNKINGHGLKLNHKQINAKGSHWQKANLESAQLDNADFSQAHFEESELVGASFKNTKLNQADFSQVTGLSAAALKEAESLKEISVTALSFSHTDLAALKDPLLEKEKGKINERPVEKPIPPLLRLEQLSVTYLRGEQLASQGRSPAWPKKDDSRWHYEQEWHGNRNQLKLCDLTPEDGLYAILERFIHLTSDTQSYQSKRFEFARLKKAYESGQLTSFGMQEIHQPPRHQGKLGSIQIHKIQINDHPELWNKYQEKKKAIQETLVREGIKSPLERIDWHRGSMTGNLPVINEFIGECWLFHGTSPNVIPLIAQNGFTTKFASKKTFVGYGALGKGIYCSDAFGKVATYVTCPSCQQNQCQCPPEKREQSSQYKKDMKAIIVARVILGKVYIDKNKSRTHEEGLPEGFHSAWGPYRESHPESSFDRNEFIVCDEAQIYPEFCVFYTDNQLTLAQNAQAELTVLPTLQVSDSSVWQQLKANVEGYYRLLKAPAWLRQKNILDLQNDIAYLYKQSPSKPQRQYLEKLQKEIKPHIELFQEGQEASDKLHTLYWALDYYDHGAWEQALYILEPYPKETLSEKWKLRIAFIQTNALYHLGRYSSMVDANNHAYLINEQSTDHYLKYPENSDLQQAYYTRGLEVLQKNHAKDEKSFCKRIAEWASTQLINQQWHFTVWTSHYWKLASTASRDIFRETLQKNVIQASQKLQAFATHVPDDQGNRLSVQQTRKDFHQALFHLQERYTEDEKKEKLKSGITLVEIRWLSLQEDGSYKIEEGYLKASHVEQLFAQNGYPKRNDCQEEGRSLVKCLRHPKTGEAITYLKFYPHYPLRQYAVDSLCARLSGYYAQTTLAWIKHPNKLTGEAYPVMLSLPLGSKQKKDKNLVTLLHHYQHQKDDAIEAALDPEAYAWKFFETLLTLPKDEKNDNLVSVSVPYNSNAYVFISLDTDDSFALVPSDKETVHVYSNRLLMSQMDQALDTNAVLEFLHRDWKGLFEAWIQDLERYTLFLSRKQKQALFDEKELQDFERLRKVGTFQSKEFKHRGYNVACDPESLFRPQDIVNVYQQVQRLHITLEKYITPTSTQKITHWTLLEQLYPQLSQHYHATYTKDKNILTSSQRFEYLPSLGEHFYRKKLPLSVSAPLISSETPKPQILTYSQSKPPLVPTFFSSYREKNPLKSYIELPDQILILNQIIHYHSDFNRLFHEIQHNKEALTFFKNPEYPDFLRERVINQLDWGKFEDVIAQEIIVAAQNTAFNFLRLHQCKVFNNIHLKSIISKSPHLTRISLQGCKNLKDNIGPLLKKVPTLTFIDLSKTEITYITTGAGSGYFNLPNLRYLILNHCKRLKDIKIISPKLEYLNLEYCISLPTKNTLLFLEKIPQLTYLNLGDHGWISFSKVLKLKLSKIKNLEISISLQAGVSTSEASLKIYQAMPSLNTLILHENGLLKSTLQDHNNSINCVAVLSDNFIVSGSANKIKVWDMKTEKCLKNLEDHSGNIKCLTKLSDNCVISISNDNVIKVWNIDTGECLKNLQGHSASINCVAVLPNNRIISGSDDKTLKVWDLDSEKCLKTLKHTTSVKCIAAFSDDRDHIISTSDGNMLKIWGTDTEKCLYAFDLSSFWNNNGRCFWIAPLSHNRIISAHVNHSTYTKINSGGTASHSESTDETHSKFNIWDIHSGKCLYGFECARSARTNSMYVNSYTGSTIYCAALLSKDRVIAGYDDNTLEVWDIETGHHLATLKGHSGSISYISALSNNRIVSGAEDKTLKVWSFDKAKYEFRSSENQADSFSNNNENITDKEYCSNNFPSFPTQEVLFSPVFNRVLRLNAGEIKTQIDKDECIVQLKDNCLTIYWSNNGQLFHKVLTAEDSKDIIPFLPEIGKESKDSALIEMIRLKCHPTRSDPLETYRNYSEHLSKKGVSNNLSNFSVKKTEHQNGSSAESVGQLSKSVPEKSRKMSSSPQFSLSDNSTVNFFESKKTFPKERVPNNFPNSNESVNRKGLKTKIDNLALLPKEFKVGTAVDDGGCFFDALAQALKVSQKTDFYSEKYLRVLCHEFYHQNKKLVNEWNKKDYHGIDRGEEYYFVQYTKPELDRDFPQHTPIWGRPHIEGKILCRKLNLPRIVIIEILKDPENNSDFPAFKVVTAEDVMDLSEEEGNELVKNLDIPVLCVSQNDLHFVPLLKNNDHASEKTTFEKSSDTSKSYGSYSEHVPKELISGQHTSIDVSGLGNNCGLFAVALGTSLALRQNPSETHTIPEFIRYIEESDVAPRSANAGEYGNLLREEILIVLQNDADYKEKRKESFIALCRDKLNGKSGERDMQSFADANQQLFGTLSIELEILNNQPKHSSTIFHLFTDNSIEAEKETFRSILVSMCDQTPEERQSMLSQSLPRTATLEAIQKYCYLFSNLWSVVYAGDASTEEEGLKRQTLNENTTNHITEVMLAHLNQLGNFSDDYLKVIYQFSQLKCLPHLLGENIKEEIAHLHCRYRVNQGWNDYYNKYLEYIKEKAPMLTADELGSLARTWKIQLIIYFSDRNQYFSQQSVLPVIVKLINPSLNHWQVIVDVPSKSITPEMIGSQLKKLTIPSQTTGYELEKIDQSNPQILWKSHQNNQTFKNSQKDNFSDSEESSNIKLLNRIFNPVFRTHYGPNISDYLNPRDIKTMRCVSKSFHGFFNIRNSNKTNNKNSSSINQQIDFYQKRLQ